MKKTSALVLAVFMIAIVAVSAMSAYYEDYPELDVRDMRRYGQDNTYLGDSPISVAPNIDGVVSPNEYQKEFVIYKDGDMKWEYVDKDINGDIHEYYAYDDDYFYMALVVPSDDARNFLQLNLNAVDSPSSACYTASTSLLFYDFDTMVVDWGQIFSIDNAREEIFETTAGHRVVSRQISVNLGEKPTWCEGELIEGGTKIVQSTLLPSSCKVDSSYDATNQCLTYEIRVSKAGLANSWRVNGERDVANIKYIGIHYSFIQKYHVFYYSERNSTYTTRKWYPQTDVNGNNATDVLDKADIGGGTLVHFVFAYSEPALVMPDTTDISTSLKENNNDDIQGQKKALKCNTSLSASLLTIIPVIAGVTLLSVKRKDD